jgi:hypothetical protein
LATSDDGLEWTSQASPVARDFSSLGLLVVEDGVVITGVVKASMAENDPEVSEHYSEDAVYALVSSDLETWGSQAWEVTNKNAEFIIDPAPRLTDDGLLVVTWYGATHTDIDPAKIEGDHDIYTATWKNGVLEGDPTPILAAEGLADPVICPLDGVDWMLLTHDSTELQLTSTSSGESFPQPTTVQADWTVPDCRTQDGHIVVTAQTERGVDAPHVAQLSPEGSWEVLDPLYETHPFIEAGTALDGHPRNNCTSPMVRPWQDGWLLACAVLILAQ